MSKATIVTKNIPQPPKLVEVAQPDKVVRTIHLEISEEEASFLRGLLGDRTGVDKIIADTHDLYQTLNDLSLPRPKFSISITNNIGVWKVESE